jgi:hypothetical protein
MAQQSPTPRTIEVKPNMDFPDAMREIIAGKKVKRMEWEDGFYIHLKEKFLMIRKPDRKDYQLIISEADLLSDDFIVIN